MKKWLEKNVGISWKTTLIGYVMAAAAVIQPMVSGEFEVNSKFIFRVIFAALIAIMGKYAADSSQVKKVDAKVDDLIKER